MMYASWACVLSKHLDMNHRTLRISSGIVLIILACMSMIAFVIQTPRTPEENLIELGRQLYFDKSLSEPNGQSCTVCHAPKTAFSDPDHAIVSEGMLDAAFVSRNGQSLTYASFIPERSIVNGEYRGGLFWDGRSNTLEDQLSGPFFNHAEMNNPDTATLIRDFLLAPYFGLYEQCFGKHVNNTTTYQNICKAISAFERSAFLNEFSSKFDLSLAGVVELNPDEKKGMELFKGKGRCVNCHSMDPDPNSGKILFTNFKYYNLGIPRNEQNPFYSTFTDINPKGKNAVDLGLGAVLKDPAQDGKFRVPTLRNVQYTKPYFHNGYAPTLREAVHFINHRDLDTTWIPEVNRNVAHQWTGSLHLTPEEEEYIVQFLFTLTDGYEEE